MINAKFKDGILIFLGWLLLGIVVVLFVSGFSSSLSPLLLGKRYLQYFLIVLVLLYINHYFLMPELYFKNRKWIYYGAILLTVGIIAVVKPFEQFMRHVRKQTEMERLYQDQKGFREMGPPLNAPMLDSDPVARMGPLVRRHPFGPHERHAVDPMSLLLYLLLIGGSMAIETNKRLSKAEQKMLQAEAARAKAELDFLKAQINPHFLFNTLNNIYAMAVANREETPESIMRLSNIMRYTMDTISRDYIGLNEELACVSDYVYLQELRGGSKLDLTYCVNGSAQGKVIAPLILISFIENAFKYGISKREQSPVIILIQIKEKQMLFQVKNKVFPIYKMEDRIGVGLENTRKRLDSLYPDRYGLNIQQVNGWYEVMLILPFLNAEG